MNNALIKAANIKRINLLKIQVEKAKELRMSKIDENELREIKRGAHKLTIKLWVIPVSIILLLTSLVSKTLFLEGISLSIMYLIALIPINLIAGNIVDFIYEKELNEGLELDNIIYEKEKEIRKLIKENKNIQVNSIVKQEEKLNSIEDAKKQDRVYTYIKKKYHK